MAKQTNTFNRRQFLKATACTSALSVGGLSSLAFADTTNTQHGMVGAASTVTLLNQSNRAVELDAAQPVSLEKVHGWVVVKLNKATEQGTETRSSQRIKLAAGEERAFDVEPTLAPALKESGGHIVITNEYSELDNMVPMAIYDVVVV